MLKSKFDKKDYRVVHTGENDRLEALLVSTKGLLQEDSDARDAKAAAAMCVQAGAFADPEDAEGLAHYLEHMVFMGSQKYPSENGYDSYVNNHGGSCNAMTEGEMTVFQFDITAEYFNKALDMFANCFISPLLKMEAADRELRAIESEFAQASMSDDVRFQQLFSHQAEDGHVLRKFSWGNMKSLSHLPQSKGIDMEAMLRSFHRTHYLPENMKLVVVAPFSLDILEKQVKKIFGGWSSSATQAQDDAIAWLLREEEAEASSTKASKTPTSNAKNKGKSKIKSKGKSDGRKDVQEDEKRGSKKRRNEKGLPSDPMPQLPTQAHILSEQVERFSQPINRSRVTYLTRVLPIKSGHRLILVWQMPSQQRDWRRKTLSYVAELMGHEGEGSILCHLKRLGYATYLSAGCDADDNFESNSMFALFRVLISLTTKGLANWPAVVGIVMRYISMLKKTGPQSWFFEELRTIQHLEYTYLDEEEEEDLAERLSIHMCSLYDRSRKDLLGSSILLYDWDPTAIEECLGRFGPDNMLVTLSSSSYPPPIASKPDEFAEDAFGDVKAEDDDEDEDEEDEEDNHYEEQEGGEDVTEEDLRALYEGPPDASDLLGLGLPPHSSMCANTEPHFNTTYWTEQLPESVLAYWQECYMDSDKSHSTWYHSNLVDGALHMPPANEYLPTDLTVVAPDTFTLERAALLAAFHFANTRAEEEEIHLAKSATVEKNAHARNGRGDSGGSKNRKGGKGSKSGKNASAPDSGSAPGRGDNDLVKKESGMAIGPDPVPSWPPDPVPSWLSSDGLPEGLRAFHLVDPRFPVPKAEICFRLASPTACRDSRSSALMDLLKGVLVDSLEKTLYYAALAGLNYSVSHSDIGLDIKFKGFSNKLPKLVLETLSKLEQPEQFITETSFDMQVEKLSRIYRNYGMKSGSLANSARLFALKRKTFSPFLRLEHLPHSSLSQSRSDKEAQSTITRQELVKFVGEFTRDMSVDVLSHGNISEVVLKDLLCNVFGDKLSNQEPSLSTSTPISKQYVLRDAAYPEEEIVKLPDAPHVSILCQSPTKTNEPSIAVDVYYQLGLQTLDDLVALDALEQVLDEPFFDLLRTKKQLGYSVSCSMRNTFGVLGFVFSVVSSSFTVQEVLDEIINFAKGVPRLITKMHRDDWANHIESLVSNRLQPPKSIYDAAGSTSVCVIERRYDLFDTKSAEVATLKKLTKDGLAAFATDLLGASTRRMLVVQASFEQSPALVSDVIPGTDQKILSDPQELHRGTETYRVQKLN